jgi:predicted O-methyltransferase YrrM
MSFNLEFVKPYSDHPEALEEVYEAALRVSKEVPEDYIFIETGTRSGGSALTILQAIKDSGVDRWFFTIDPYGLKPYKVGDEIVTLDYDESHYRRAMKVLADFSLENNLNHAHFRIPMAYHSHPESQRRSRRCPLPQ